VPNEIIVVETPVYETRTVYGTQVTEMTCSEEYGRFADLTQKLVRVSKPEVDEQRSSS
jgi:hypothetical protein